MSIRYGVDLVLDPDFTALVYRARQVICGQYGSWAAEMQMLRMPLAPYFSCTEAALPVLAAEAGSLAHESRLESPSFPVHRVGVAADAATNGIVLEFAASGSLVKLQRKAVELAQRHSGDSDADSAPFRPHIALLEYGAFPEAILPDAVEFAHGVAAGLSLPLGTRAWRLLLTRYYSGAAGDDWSGGRWAADLSWQQLYSYAL